MSGLFTVSSSREGSTDEVKSGMPAIGIVPFGVGRLSLNPGFMNQPVDPFQFMEACTTKAVLSMVMGGTMVCYNISCI